MYLLIFKRKKKSFVEEAGRTWNILRYESDSNYVKHQSERYEFYMIISYCENVNIIVDSFTHAYPK